MIRHATIAVCTFFFFVATSPATADDVRQSILEKVNAARRKAERSPLKPNEKLQQAAQSHADWMARTGKMVHLQGEKPTGNSREVWSKSTWHPINRAIRAGYLDLNVLSTPNANDHIGENIAHGKPDSGPNRFRPRAIVNGWMNSPGHRQTLLGDYREIGVGVMITSRGDVFWCAVFGKP